MRILGHGIDLVGVERIDDLITRHQARFLDRCFTVREQAYCEKGGIRRAERYAARFAAKEAVLKALGRGLRSGLSWTDIEVVPDAWGRPDVGLQGVAAQLAEKTGIVEWHLSLTHVENYASASVIAVGSDPGC
ncbi:MAG: holo-ACP synthase [Phycisphaerales bacterium]|nr:holo-ACP synthase [Phycisphaerales bacterium]